MCWTSFQNNSIYLYLSSPPDIPHELQAVDGVSVEGAILADGNALSRFLACLDVVLRNPFEF